MARGKSKHVIGRMESTYRMHGKGRQFGKLKLSQVAARVVKNVFNGKPISAKVANQVKKNVGNCFKHRGAVVVNLKCMARGRGAKYSRKHGYGFIGQKA